MFYFFLTDELNSNIMTSALTITKRANTILETILMIKLIRNRSFSFLLQLVVVEVCITPCLLYNILFR